MTIRLGKVAMKKTGAPLMLVAATFTVGCAYQVPTNIKPSYNVYSAYDEKIPARAAVFVDASQASKDVRVKGYSCSAHRFPVDAESAVANAVIATLGNLVEDVQKVDRPLSRGELSAYGADAMVLVKVEDMDVDLVVIPGFWSAEMESDAEIVFGVKADTRDGRKLGTMVSGKGEARANIGSACEGGAIAIGEALEDALDDALAQLGEAVSNSERFEKPCAE
jgi:hypothetical protein